MDCDASVISQKDMKKVELFEKDKYKNIEPLARNMARGDMNSFFRFFS